MHKNRNLSALVAALAIIFLGVGHALAEESAECQALMNQYKTFSVEYLELAEKRAVHQAAASVLANKARQLDPVIKQFKAERDRIQSMINRGTYAYYGIKAAALYAGVKGLSLLRLPALTHTAVTTGAMAGEWSILGKAWAAIGAIQTPKFAVGSLHTSSKGALAEFEGSINQLESIRNKFREKGLRNEAEAQRLYRTRISGLEQKAKEFENQLFKKCKEEKKTLSDLSGIWYAGGEPPAIPGAECRITQNGDELTFYNEHGMASDGKLITANTVVAWGGLKGDISADAKRITWANNTFWWR